MNRFLPLFMLLVVLFFPACVSQRPPRPDHTLRVASWNIEDVRAADIDTPSSQAKARLESVAATIDRIKPQILLLNEIAYDHPTASSVTSRGQNAQRFADRYLPRHGFTAWMPESNTGEPSGHDLDRSGEAITELVSIDPALPQTAAQRAYGNDAFGFGTFPGQYAMGLLVAPGYEILHDRIRTFRLFRWADLPDAQPPANADGTPWYTPEAWAEFRLSSKTLAAVPVRLPSGTIIYCVISHPTPPAFDGPEGRNKHRNRDEIRLLRAYLDNAPWLTDDQGHPGGLPPGAHAIVLGDLNADPRKGSSIGDPIAHLLASPVLGPDPAPISDILIEQLDPSDTAMFRLRVDYVLPTAGIEVADTGVWRDFRPVETPPIPPTPSIPAIAPSDHFPVWADIVVPDTKRR